MSFKNLKNKKKMESMIDSRLRPFSQRTTKLSTLIQQDQLRFQNDFKQFYKFMWPYYYREKRLDISNFFDYPIEVVDSFTLLPNIHPVRFLSGDPIYLQPLKIINIGTFNYYNLKSPELINLGNPWFLIIRNLIIFERTLCTWLY